jgi:UDP-N-acetylglucosamine 2-epimerase (non-hydrolysing)
MAIPHPMKVLSIFGTRPEAIKMAPVVRALAAQPEWFTSKVCVTAQHRQMLDQMMATFGLTADYDLDVMQPGQDLFQITTGVLNGIKPVLAEFQPDMVLVQGDTTTTMAASLACFYLKIPVGHIEAGLRTFDKYYPFPEEINRVITDNIATLYFPPTPQTEQHLRKMGVPPERITMTGNTVIDALQWVLAQAKAANTPLPIDCPQDAPVILITAHRREHFGPPMQEVADAIRTLAERYPGWQFVFPVHPNPNVRQVVMPTLGGLPNVHLLEPLDYVPFSLMMARATLILSDSGGVQEEAPSLDKPVLLLRDETERPEGVEVGAVQLIGPHRDKLIHAVETLMHDPAAYVAMAQAPNPYGDGQAATRIAEALWAYHQQSGQ